MAMTFEKALAGEYGEEVQNAANDAVLSAIDKVGEMFKASIPRASEAPLAFIGGVLSPSTMQTRYADGRRRKSLRPNR